VANDSGGNELSKLFAQGIARLLRTTLILELYRRGLLKSNFAFRDRAQRRKSLLIAIGLSPMTATLRTATRGGS